MNKNQIINSQIKLEDDSICGIYFLILKDEIVYVGQSINCIARIKQHCDKNFDAYFIKEVKQNHLDEEEKKYIYEFVPKYNKRLLISKDDLVFITKRWLWENKDKIPNQKIEVVIIKGQIFIKKNNLTTNHGK